MPLPLPNLYGYPAIVVDFGTAVTFDIISGAGAYIGGVIAPGLEAMTNFLYQRTALLPRLSLREPEARDWEIDARSDDVGRGLRISRPRLRNYRANQRRNSFVDKRFAVVATGGYAQLIAARVRRN